MPVRTAEAVWEGSSREGQGTIRTSSGSFESRYNWSGRFEEGPGTNPEELIGAAHAGCFSMALAGNLARAGHKAERIQTRARVHIERVGDGWKITLIELDTEALVPGMDEAGFRQQAEAAKKGCPVSQALAAVNITLNSRLLS